MPKKAIHITFPREKIKEPVIYHLGHKFKVVTTILRANVTHDEGWVVLELEGADTEIEKAEKWLSSLGLKISSPGTEEN